MLCGNSTVGLGSRFAIQRVKYEIAILIDQTGDSVDKLKPRLLVELCRRSVMSLSTDRVIIDLP